MFRKGKLAPRGLHCPRKRRCVVVSAGCHRIADTCPCQETQEVSPPTCSKRWIASDLCFVPRNANPILGLKF